MAAQQPKAFVDPWADREIQFDMPRKYVPHSSLGVYCCSRAWQAAGARPGRGLQTFLFFVLKFFDSGLTNRFHRCSSTRWEMWRTQRATMETTVRLGGSVCIHSAKKTADSHPLLPTGHLYVTNLRLMWDSAKRPQINLCAPGSGLRWELVMVVS